MILFLEKRGCDFWEDEPIKSDVGNYRVTTTDYNIEGKDGKFYFVSFMLWRNKGHYRTTTKNGKRELKKPVFEIDIENGLAIEPSFNDDEGTFLNLTLEKKVNNKNFEYTKQGILSAVNMFSKYKYTSIEFIN